MANVPVLDARSVRRLALVQAGLLSSKTVPFPRRASGSGKRARSAAHSVIDHFGYLQLDTVSVAGARSHALVLLSRLEGLHPELGEDLLRPGEPLFEYWGHEASWMPMDLYPVFGFRRRGMQNNPYIGPILREEASLARTILKRVRDDGPIRSQDLEGENHGPWWGYKKAKRVAVALWSVGKLAVRRRRNFQRSLDLPERVIPETVRGRRVERSEAVAHLLGRALDGHGWATTGTLADTWRFRNMKKDVTLALDRLVERGEAVPCGFRGDDGRTTAGWIRPQHLELAEDLRRARPRRDQGVLLSPFDPLLWERRRVRELFGFDLKLEIFTPPAQRKYGYFCLPVLAGERLVARIDLKADRSAGTLQVVSEHRETDSPEVGEAVRTALHRYSNALQLPVQKQNSPRH